MAKSIYVPVPVLALVGVALCALVIGIIANGSAPSSYEGVANDARRDCMEKKGDGHWVGSSGVTLEDFCNGVGSLVALQKLKQDHPERF